MYGMNRVIWKIMLFRLEVIFFSYRKVFGAKLGGSNIGVVFRGR